MKGKVVVVTGGSSGIGKALVHDFAAMGCHVVTASRNEEVLNENVSELTRKGHSVIPVVADVSKEEDCKRIIDTCIETYGTIDILICNAGVSMRAAFIDLDLNVLKKLMDTNFWGTVYCTKYSLPHILKNRGSIVGVSSIAGYQGLPGRTGYSASKSAIRGFLDTLRIEHLHEHLHVMIACPSFTSTNIRKTALNKEGHIQGESPRDESKMMTAEQVSARIIRGIRKRRRTLIMTFKGKIIVFLNKMFPWFIDRQTFKAMAQEPNSPIK
jgi:dehydrogenase/reductase SDR family member 7B